VNCFVTLYKETQKQVCLVSEMEKLHLVSFNVPYPPNYGGIIDVFYKIKSLHRAGVGIILHCFSYGRQHAKELEEFCEKVFYYDRLSGMKFFLRKPPYIVATRTSNTMPKNLLSDNHPVLFEGLHTTAMLESCRKAGKFSMVRTHNIEHNYYLQLSRSERNFFSKTYLRMESNKLKRYENILSDADSILAISKTDTRYFQNHYGNAHFIPAFHQYDKISVPSGKGDFILVHGNLAVPENKRSVLFLIRNILSKISNYRVIIAGKNPGRLLENRCNKYPHIELYPNPDNTAMEDLVREAHINLLYTAQPTGLKLKLLHSLYAGRHCIANPLMVSGSGLDELCHLFNMPSQAIQLIEQLMQQPVPNDEIELRSRVLADFDTDTSARKIIDLMDRI